jgi:hypothetical protein
MVWRQGGIEIVANPNAVRGGSTWKVSEKAVEYFEETA